MTRKTIVAIAVLLAAVAAVALTGCKAGVSKEERLDMFKEDALAGRNLRKHFSGPNADAVDSDTLSEIFDPSDKLSFDSGNGITGSYFSFGWSTGAAGHRTASGTLTVETDGTSETWYIYRIDPGDGSGDIPYY